MSLAIYIFRPKRHYRAKSGEYIMPVATKMDIGGRSGVDPIQILGAGAKFLNR
jgi:hypothetical protein